MLYQFYILFLSAIRCKYLNYTNISFGFEFQRVLFSSKFDSEISVRYLSSYAHQMFINRILLVFKPKYTKDKEVQYKNYKKK